jgi:hypothetical protein
MVTSRLSVWAVVTCLHLALPMVAARAVPEADHVRLECQLLRLKVNDYTIRYQLNVRLALSAPTDAALRSAEESELTVVNASGQGVTLAPQRWQLSPRQFKAAHATLLFSAIEDTSVPYPSEPSNVPDGFFASGGPFDVAVTSRSDRFTGRVDFGRELRMRVLQNGEVITNFCLADELPFLVETSPRQFGPVYYKRQDLTNSVYQLANMEQSLESQDYHPVVESPQYLFQIRIGDPAGGPTRLVDPARYIEGYTAYLIRSEQTSTPLSFAADEFSAGDVVAIDFERTDTLPPDSVFSAGRQGFSSQTRIQDRVVYAMYVERPPTPEELGQLSAIAAGSGATGKSVD